MGAGFRVFTTEQVAALVGLDVKKDKWRVVKFVQSPEYGIKPSVSLATGSGSRRLYDLENVCEIALALRLLEAGLRSMVIGKVIWRLRGALHTKLEAASKDAEKVYLAIIRTPETGKPLDGSRVQVVEWVRGIADAEALRRKHANNDLIFVAPMELFAELKQRLQKMDSEKGVTPHGGL